MYKVVYNTNSKELLFPTPVGSNVFIFPSEEVEVVEFDNYVEAEIYIRANDLFYKEVED